MRKQDEDTDHEESMAESEQTKLDGSLMTTTTSYVYHGRLVNMANKMKEELDRRRRAVWAAFGPHK
ncbi:hypothetical protein KIN20_032628 [Parelaphostrongylus tenuis]|uniref:Uncharacterized protein n=1 Tax=Parelaphostrongylus tenuis TaxID=148309 RepID=A0AAD5WI82_PARTN|nr:hypothetical protein KIN20_032628 [Parelaphostrongylus tenuis]